VQAPVAVPAPVVTPEEAPPAPVETPRMAARRLYAEGQRIFHAHGSKQENWLAARRLYLEAISADPTLVPPYAAAVFSYTNMVMTGLSLDPEDDLRRAEALARRLTAIAPDHPQTRNARAALLREQGRFEEALEAYRAALALDADLFAARANAGYMLILLGRPQEGADLVRITLAERGADHSFAGTWQTYLGIAALHAGMPSAAAQHFRSSLLNVAFLPFAERQLHLAAALALSGDVAAAQLLVAEVTRRHPEIDEAWLRARALSQRSAYLEQREALFQGLTLAGFRR
jgi:predicted Zn-dependent protease